MIMVNNAVAQTTDITPSPRILWVLGQIPFRPWQALAELIDNSLDAFLSAERNGKLPANARVDVNWSSSSVSQENRVIEINDRLTYNELFKFYQEQLERENNE